MVHGFGVRFMVFGPSPNCFRLAPKAPKKVVRIPLERIVSFPLQTPNNPVINLIDVSLLDLMQGVMKVLCGYTL